jgi:hypothetical protein
MWSAKMREPRQTSRRQKTPPKPGADTTVVIVSPQSRDIIHRRREIREAFHDAKALTIKGPRL